MISILMKLGVRMDLHYFLLFAALLRAENRAPSRRRQRARYEANREEVLASSRARYEANREKILAQVKAYREANREKILAGRKVQVEEMRAPYMRQILTQGTTLKAKDIPEDLVDLKRAHLRVKRELVSIRKAHRKNTTDTTNNNDCK